MKIFINYTGGITDKKLKFALIGAGGICSRVHVPGYLNMDNVEIVAVCDIIEERAKAVAEMTGAKIVCTDYKDILKIDGLDAVDICTPNYMNSVIAVDALNRGINVFCEKPACPRIEKTPTLR